MIFNENRPTKYFIYYTKNYKLRLRFSLYKILRFLLLIHESEIRKFKQKYHIETSRFIIIKQGFTTRIDPSFYTAEFNVY